MFKGAITAIVTPFTEKCDLDEPCLRNLVDFQLKNKIDGIVACGTTGEGPTLTEKEHEKIFEIIIENSNSKTKVIASTGTNCTAKSIELTKKAKDLGADASLLLCPYYNKPTQEGMYRHFCEIANAVDIPIIIYNIAGRTCVNLETQTLARLAKEHSNIVGVKEASGNMAQMMDVISLLPKEFDVLSGDDNLTLPLMALGGKGVISVASNIIPKEMHDMTDYALKGNFKDALNLHYKFLPMFKGIFLETNPIPIKAALAMKGMVKEVYRLPMCGMKEDNREKLKRILAELKLV